MPPSPSFDNVASHRPPPDLHLVTGHGETDARTVSAAAVAGALCHLFTKASESELSSLLRSIEQGDASTAARVAHEILRPIAFPAQAQAANVADDVEAMQHFTPAESSALLSTRELKVLWLISRGWSNREIAEATHRSINTIEAQVKSLYRKLAVKSRTQAIREAMNQGLLIWRTGSNDPSAMATNDAMVARDTEPSPLGLRA